MTPIGVELISITGTKFTKVVGMTPIGVELISITGTICTKVVDIALNGVELISIKGTICTKVVDTIPIVVELISITGTICTKVVSMAPVSVETSIFFTIITEIVNIPLLIQEVVGLHNPLTIKVISCTINVDHFICSPRAVALKVILITPGIHPAVIPANTIITKIVGMTIKV